jgi:hypothetical protein
MGQLASFWANLTPLSLKIELDEFMKFLRDRTHLWRRQPRASLSLSAHIH